MIARTARLLVQSDVIVARFPSDCAADSTILMSEDRLRDEQSCHLCAPILSFTMPSRNE